ncbi:MAG: GMC family oxidoreductase [Rhizobiaceae bacterium]|nr:GMC family oxidoreductase [Rhizobiaceae bacterium]
MADLSTDVLIVGAGLSGAVVARRLSENGIKVICLEQGVRHNREDYRGRHRDWEIAALGPWHASPNVRRNPADYPINDTESAMKPLMFNGVGGSTILYGAHWMRFLPSDFRVRSLDGAADDWPITYSDIEPYYNQVDIDFGASGIAGDPAYPSHPDYPMPPLPINIWGEKVAAGHNRLGWHWWPGSNAIASRPYQGRYPCVQRSTCGYGCNEGAKASVDITHWPIAESLGAQLITEARVSRITHDRYGRATGAIYKGADGVERSVAANTTILAANAVGTARLLLMSHSAKYTAGLANASGLVGKRLMMHPFTRVVGFFDEPMESWQGHWGQSLYSLEFAETRADVGFIRGAKWNLGPSGGPLHAAMFSADGRLKAGEDLHSHVKEWVGRTAIWGISCDDLPEEDNTVSLDAELVDADNNPAPKLTYKISPNSEAILKFNKARATESLEASGAYKTISNDVMPEYGWHPLGTCRMGTSSDNSVVDQFGAVHDVENLYIVDGSVFVTGSSVNPAATIAALALRAADSIIKNRK